METCKLCQAIQQGVKVDGKLCAVVDIDGAFVAVSKAHSDSCEYEVVSEATDMLWSLKVGGALAEYSDAVGHFGLVLFPYDKFSAQSRTRE